MPLTATTPTSKSVEPIMANLALTNACGAEITSIQFRLVGDPSWTDMLAFGEVIPKDRRVIGKCFRAPMPQAHIGDQVLTRDSTSVDVSGTYDWTVLRSPVYLEQPPQLVADRRGSHLPGERTGAGPQLVEPRRALHSPGGSAPIQPGPRHRPHVPGDGTEW